MPEEAEVNAMLKSIGDMELRVERMERVLVDQLTQVHSCKDELATLKRDINMRYRSLARRR